MYRLSPAFLQRLAWRVANRLGAVSQTVKFGPAKGLKIVAPFNRRLDFCYGNHEPHVTQAIEKYLPPAGTAVDVGAFLGSHTLSMAAQVGRGGHVLAFEPYTENADLLERTLRINQLSWVNLFRFALGNMTSQVRMFGPKSSMMTTLDLKDNPHTDKSNPVEMIRLDDQIDITNLLTRLDLVKVDVEGGEFAALNGMEALIEHYHPVIICELTLHPWVPYKPLELLDWLRGHEYSLAILSDQSQPVSEFIERLVRSRASDKSLGMWYVTHILAC
jgi:FkbM family methyltransferase